MIIDRTRKFIFLKNPRCAGSAVEESLISSINFDSNSDISGGRVEEHTTLDEVYEILPDATGFRIFCTIRDPIDRFIDACAWVACIQRELDSGREILVEADIQSKDLSNIDVFKAQKVISRQLKMAPAAIIGKVNIPLLSEQILWAQHPIYPPILYKFEDVDKMFSDICSYLGVSINLKSARNLTNMGPFIRGNLTDAQIAELKSLYSNDYEMWNKFK